MTWVIIAAVAVLGTLAVSLVYYFVVGPSQHADGVADEQAAQKAKADGLKVGTDAVQKMADAASKTVTARAEADKERDSVDVANDLIMQKLGKVKKP